jgi:hypothetical protein
LLLDNGLMGKTCACVALGHSGMARKTFVAQQFGTKNAVTDVRMGAVAMNGGGIGVKHTYVVQHGSFVDERMVEVPFGMPLGYGQCLACYSSTVKKE